VPPGRLELPPEPILNRLPLPGLGYGGGSNLAASAGPRGPAAPSNAAGAGTRVTSRGLSSLLAIPSAGAPAPPPPTPPARSIEPPSGGSAAHARAPRTAPSTSD